jgi:hypothetical protein
MCTQKPPHDYSQQLYDKYRESFEEYISSMVSTAAWCLCVLILVVARDPLILAEQLAARVTIILFAYYEWTDLFCAIYGYMSLFGCSSWFVQK